MDTPTGPAPTDRSGRGRRDTRVSAEDRERLILATAEALLESRSLHDISVDDLARGAGLSRPAFYFYFASKEQVLLTLLDRLVQDQEQDEDAMPWNLADDPARVWRQVLGTSVTRWSAHRGVLRATMEARATSAEVRQVWGQLLGRFVDRTALAIEAERARGLAPPGLPAHDLALCLNRMNEKVFEAMAADLQPHLAEERLLDTLVGIWLSAIYGSIPFTTPSATPTPPAHPQEQP